MTPFIVSRDGNLKTMTMFLSGVPRTIDETHTSFQEILDGINDLTTQEIRDLLDLDKAMRKTLARFGNIVVDGGTVSYKGEVVHGLLADRMIQMLEDGQDIKAWALFMENLQQNPAKHAVDELYLWLERSGMPITERGNFLAYKKVQDDYTSYHVNADGSKFFNNIGTLCSMPRNKVDDNRNKTCSSGLHFCSWDYLPHYMGNRGKVLLVEVNPAHVVSIPSDYNNAKGRAEAYLVVGELPENETQHAFQTPYAGYDDSDYITWEQTDEIDYSGIDDGWYDDYDAEEEDAIWNFSYDQGLDAGRKDGRAAYSIDVDEAFDDDDSDYDLIFEAFADGYNDGYHDEFNDYVDEDAWDEEDETVADPEWVDTPEQAQTRGYLCGLNKDISHFTALVTDGTNYTYQFNKGFFDSRHRWY